MDDESMADYALGLLSPRDRAAADEERRASPELDLALAALEEELALAATAALTPIAPPSPARLLAALDGPERFAAFVPAIMRVFDLGREAVRALLARVDELTAWQPSPIAGVREIHFQAGPAVLATDAGFVRMAAGLRFPRHRHLGPEIGVVLEGALHDEGRIHFPGDVVEWPAHSVHEYQAGAQRDLLLMVAHSGIQLTRARE
jgi:quercetin dioxygenase-like cupin family protein